MRRLLVLFAAAVPLLVVPSAVAATNRSEESRCPAPDAHSRYALDRFTVRVSLPASGCASREDGPFDLSIQVVRMDNHWGRDVTERTRVCRPQRASCDLTLTVDHPDVENAQYDVTITYPGAATERTMNAVLFCTSDGHDASCDR